MDFRTALARLMEAENLSPEHIAIAAKTSVFTVHRWIRGESEPKYSAVVALVSAYPTLGRLLKQAVA